mgnify:CR=1 FL=1
MGASKPSRAARVGGLILVLALVGCTRMTDFDRPLELPDFRDAGTEVTFACESDEDCTALGPCVICDSNVCLEAPEADQANDPAGVEARARASRRARIRACAVAIT